jgi:hypothetical protein
MRGLAADRCVALAALLAWGLRVTPSAALEVGEGQRARPALATVPVADSARAGKLAAAADVVAGLTEALQDDDSSHTRAMLAVAGSIQALSWLNLGLAGSGRYDHHGADAEGGDDGAAFESELSAQLAWRAGALGYGAALGAWQPAGPDIGTSIGATGVDARALLAHHGQRFVVAGYAGYRLDRSEKASENAARLRFGDRVALGASEYDAVLLGVGAGYLAGRTWLFGEASARLLLGAEEPGASPCRVTLGARRAFGDSGLSGEVSLSALVTPYPEVAASSPLMPIEPRALLAIGIRFGSGRKLEQAAPKTPAAPPVQPVASAPERLPTQLELSLLDDQGQPLRGAQVTLIRSSGERPLNETAPGHYVLDDVPAGAARVRIRAEGYQPIDREIRIGETPDVRLDVRAQPALPPGQVRGLVRSFRGKALGAKVRVEPAGIEAQTDAEGFFQIDVPPGQYDVVIEAPGFQPQRRAVKVDQQGVVIVNADLGQAP